VAERAGRRGRPDGPEADAASARDPLGAALEAGLAAVVLAAPIPFGAVGPGGRLLIEAAAAVLVVVWAVRAFGRPTPLPSAPVRAALVGLVGLAALQLVPLGAGVVGALSPRTVELHQAARVPDEVRAIEARLAGVDPAPAGPRALSVDPPATASALRTGAALAGLAFVATTVVAARGARRLAFALLVAASLEGLYGVLVLASGHDRILWLPKRHYLEAATGTFVNKNHFAGWMIMGLPLAIGYLLSLAAIWHRHMGRGWRDRLLWLSSPEGGRVQLVAFAIVVMGLALALTMSRSGLLALVLALSFSVVIGARRNYSLKVRAVLSAGLLVLLAGSVLWADVDVARRFTSGSRSIELRRAAWRDAVSIVRDFPLTGTGLNTYATATLKYDTTHSDLQFHQAHNDYLQIAAEGGLWLFLPALVALIACVRGVRQRLRDDAPDPAAYWMRFGAAMGMLAMAMQSLVEFSLQMPGNAAMFVVLTAVALHPSRPPHVEQRAPR